MHSQLTPFRICRNAIIGLAISLVLLIVAYSLPFYTYRYFLINETMKFVDVANANKQIFVPFVSVIVAWVFMLAAVMFMLFVSKNKILMFISKAFSLVAAFVFLGFFFVAVVRLWVIPYEFDYLAYQQLEVGYIFYLIYLLFGGVLSCYILAIHEK